MLDNKTIDVESRYKHGKYFDIPAPGYFILVEVTQTNRTLEMENYVVQGRVGEGAHGIVMQAKHKSSGQVVALKKIPLKRLEDGISESTIREIRALQQLDSIYIVKLYDVFPQGLGFVLVFEFMTSDLAEVIKVVLSRIIKFN